MVHARGAGSIAGDMLPFQQGQALYTTDCRRVVCAVGRISAAADDAGFFLRSIMRKWIRLARFSREKERVWLGAELVVGRETSSAKFDS